MNVTANSCCRLLFTPTILATLWLWPAAQAQTYARQELTISLEAQTFGGHDCTQTNGLVCDTDAQHHLSYPVPSLTYSYNLAPGLALEGTYMPSSEFLETNGQAAGREMLMLGGVKTGWRGNRWGFYGRIQTGASSFSCGAFQYSPGPYANCSWISSFALEYGGTAEYRLRDRWGLRLDAGHLLMLAFDETHASGLSGIERSGATPQHFDLRLGVTRSFGEMRDAPSETVPERAAWDAGVLFGFEPRTLPDYAFMNAYPAAGIWASWNFSEHVSWDVAAMRSGRNTGSSAFLDFQAGGRSVEALTGAKIGIRRGRMGYFGKIRAGTMTFGETERQVIQVQPGVVSVNRGMFTNMVLDTGGVLEVYPSRHWILRADAGSATIFYRQKNLIDIGETVAIPGQSQVSILMTAGAGFRF